VLREFPKLAYQCAKEGATFEQFLLRLVLQEMLDRERRATERRIKAAKFPVSKSLETYDFLAIPLPSGPRMLGSERLTGALLDLLTYHVHILEMNGDRFQLKSSRKKKGSGHAITRQSGRQNDDCLWRRLKWSPATPVRAARLGRSGSRPKGRKQHPK
jgi:hypothetical protein